MGTQNLKLFELVLVSIPLYAVIIIIFYKFYEKQNNESMQANAVVSSTIIESISGIETIKSLRNEEKVYDKIENQLKKYLTKVLKLQKMVLPSLLLKI